MHYVMLHKNLFLELPPQKIKKQASKFKIIIPVQLYLKLENMNSITILIIFEFQKSRIINLKKT